MSAATRRPEQATASERRLQFEREALPHLDGLYAYAARLTRGNTARAEDLVQETLLSAFRAWHTFRRGSNCRAWLFTILRNQAATFFRRRSNRGPEIDIDEVAERRVLEAARAEDPEGRFFRELVDDEISEAIDALPAVYREAVVLSDLHGLPYAEISEITGVPVGTVKSRIFRGRQTLQQRLYEYAVVAGYVTPREQAGVPAEV